MAIEDELRSAAEKGATFDARDSLGRPREIEADVLYELCVEAVTVRPHGVDLSHAVVNGNLDFEGAEFRVSLTVTDCTIRGSVVLARANALEVNIERCAVDGEVRGDEFRSRHGLSLEHSRIAGTVTLLGIRTEGSLTLCGTRVDGRDAVSGESINLDGARVGGSVVMRDNMVLAGALHIPGIVIEGDLDLDGAHVLGPDGNGDAIVATACKVGGRAVFRSNFRPVGRLWFAGADAGEISFRDARLSAAEVSLSDASCRLFIPTWAEAPTNMSLDGFRFTRCRDNDSQRPWRDGWLSRRGPVEWSPDPYEQLASYFRSAGHDGLAREVQIAKNWVALRERRWPRRWAGAVVGILVGFGYRKWPATVALAAVLACAMVTYAWVDSEGGMVPVDPPQGSVACGADYPCFNWFVYGADVVLPVIDFGQDSSWYPDSTTTAGHRGEALRWAFIALGWFLTTIFVAALAARVSRD
jgi:hypothetical protein